MAGNDEADRHGERGARVDGASACARVGAAEPQAIERVLGLDGAEVELELLQRWSRTPPEAPCESEGWARRLERGPSRPRASRAVTAAPTICSGAESALGSSAWLLAPALAVVVWCAVELAERLARESRAADVSSHEAGAAADRLPSEPSLTRAALRPGPAPGPARPPAAATDPEPAGAQRRAGPAAPPLSAGGPRGSGRGP